MADDRRRSLLSLIALDVMAGERPNELQSWFTALADDVRLVLESENLVRLLIILLSPRLFVSSPSQHVAYMMGIDNFLESV